MQTWPPQPGISRPMIRDRWYDQQTSGVYNALGGGVIATNTLYTLIPFTNWNLSSVSYKAIGFDVDASPATDLDMLLGIYRDDNGQPTTKIVEVSHTILAATPVGGVEIPLTLTLPSGVYWILYCFDNNPVTGVRIMGWDPGTVAEGFSMLGTADTEGVTSVPKHWGWVESGLTHAFPASLPDTMIGIPLAPSAGPTDRLLRMCLQVA